MPRGIHALVQDTDNSYNVAIDPIENHVAARPFAAQSPPAKARSNVREIKQQMHGGQQFICITNGLRLPMNLPAIVLRSNAWRGKFLPLDQTTGDAVMDADVEQIQIQSGRGYQTRINAALRQLIEAETSRVDESLDFVSKKFKPC